MGKRFDVTRIVLIIFSLAVIGIAVLVQLTGQSKISAACSYLDPVTIDFLAFFAALFLIIEGIYDIYKNKNLKLKYQITRILRIGFGFAIITLHVIQFLHK